MQSGFGMGAGLMAQRNGNEYVYFWLFLLPLSLPRKVLKQLVMLFLCDLSIPMKGKRLVQTFLFDVRKP